MLGSLQMISESELFRLLEAAEMSPTAYRLVEELISRFETLERKLEMERAGNATT